MPCFVAIYSEPRFTRNLSQCYLNAKMQKTDTVSYKDTIQDIMYRCFSWEKSWNANYAKGMFRGRVALFHSWNVCVVAPCILVNFKIFAWKQKHSLNTIVPFEKLFVFRIGPRFLKFYIKNVIARNMICLIFKFQSHNLSTDLKNNLIIIYI